MKITLSPSRVDVPLVVSVNGDTLTINGEEFDFGPLTDGATLPLEAFESMWFNGPVDRVAGELQLSLVLPYGPNAPESTVFYSGTLDINESGDLVLPIYDTSPPIEGEIQIEPSLSEEDSDA